MDVYFICELSWTVSCTVLYIPYAQSKTHGHHSFKKILSLLYHGACIQQSVFYCGKLYQLKALCKKSSCPLLVG